MVGILKILIPAIIASAAIIPHASQAQSFDCRKAKTDTEWAICNTPELRKLDEKVVSTYHGLITNPGSPSGLKAAAEQLQSSWLHWERDQCYGDVGCLINAYKKISDSLSAMPYTFPSTPASTAKPPSIMPSCGAPASDMDDYRKAMCGNKELLALAMQVDQLANALQPRLPGSLKTVLDQQQKDFPMLTGYCPNGEAISVCISKTLNARVRDLEDLTATLGKSVPNCRPSEMSIKDSDVGDGGASNVYYAYLIEYEGTGTCQIRGFPTVLVFDESGKALVGKATYVSSAALTPDLPVTLSAKNRTAWFRTSIATACENGPNGEKVSVSLPLSQEWIRTLDFPGANCGVTISPVSMISVMRSSFED